MRVEKITHTNVFYQHIIYNNNLYRLRSLRTSEIALNWATLIIFIARKRVRNKTRFKELCQVNKLKNPMPLLNNYLDNLLTQFNINNLFRQRFIPGVEGLFFGEFCSCSVIGIKFAVHMSPLAPLSDPPQGQGLLLGSASVTTMQMSSPFSWLMSPPWMELNLLPFLERFGVIQGERFSGVAGAEVPDFCWCFSLGVCKEWLDPLLQLRWRFTYSLPGDIAWWGEQLHASLQRQLWLKKTNWWGLGGKICNLVTRSLFNTGEQERFL